MGRPCQPSSWMSNCTNTSCMALSASCSSRRSAGIAAGPSVRTVCRIRRRQSPFCRAPRARHLSNTGSRLMCHLFCGAQDCTCLFERQPNEPYPAPEAFAASKVNSLTVAKRKCNSRNLHIRLIGGAETATWPFSRSHVYKRCGRSVDGGGNLGFRRTRGCAGGDPAGDEGPAGGPGPGTGQVLRQAPRAGTRTPLDAVLVNAVDGDNQLAEAVTGDDGGLV